MTRAARLVLAVASGVALLAVLLSALLELPRFGTGNSAYADPLVGATIHERHASNAVTDVTYDIRGFDSLGEEMILLGSVSGVCLLLARKNPRRSKTRFPVSPLVHFAAVPFFVLLALFALYVCWNGHLGMGGGFQGGVIGFGAFALVYFARDLRTARRFADMPKLDVSAGLGGGTFVTVGLIGLAVGGSFLWNWLPYGSFGDLFSAGVVPFISFGVGLEVAAGFSILLVQFASEVDPQGE